MRLKIGTNLRTASLNSKFTGLYKKSALKIFFEINMLWRLVWPSFKPTLCCTVKVENCIANQKILKNVS